LAALKQLRTVELVNAGATAGGVEELRKALPDCVVTQTQVKGLLLPPPLKANAQPGRTIDLEIAHTRNYDEPFLILCVPLSLSQKDAGLGEVLVEIPGGGPKAGNLGQLTAPGLLTEHIKPAADQVRRDLHFQVPAPSGRFKAGTVTKVKVQLKSPGLVGYGLDAWKIKEGEYAELTQNYGKWPVLRYLHRAYDNSTREKRAQTARVFHHVYGLASGKGGVDPFGLRHDLVYGYNKVTFAGDRECDLWNGQPGDAHQAHAGFQATASSRTIARQRVAVDWHGPNKEVLAREEREITAYSLGPRGTLVDFVSRLKAAGGPVHLRGDPHHAGFQFQASKDVQDAENLKQTYFLRPDGKGAPGETRSWDPTTRKGPTNVPWGACSFVLAGKRYTAAYLSHPGNPGEARWGERASGGMGCYVEHDLAEKTPLVVHYRVWLQNGEMTVDQVAALAAAFRDPPKVKVIDPPQ
jgi:hypothetical protein